MRQLIVILLLMIFMLPGAVFASIPAGRVIISLGSVIDANSGTTRLLKRGDNIFSGDVIKTSAGAKAQLRFTDNTLVALEENSEFTVKNYQLSAQTAGKVNQYTVPQNTATSPTPAVAVIQKTGDLRFAPTQEVNDHMIVAMAKGGLRMVTGAIGKSNPSAYQVGTVVGTIAVRGTAFSVHSVKKSTKINVDKGDIFIILANDRVVNLGPSSAYSIVTISETNNTIVLSLQKDAVSPPETVTIQAHTGAIISSTINTNAPEGSTTSSSNSSSSNSNNFNTSNAAPSTTTNVGNSNPVSTTTSTQSSQGGPPP